MWFKNTKEIGQMKYKIKPIDRWRSTLHEIIFEADTPVGKAFDILLILTIMVSVFVVMLDSVQAVHVKHAHLLSVIEWIITGLFTVEYAMRILSVQRPAMYMRSFYGIVDVLAILPSYTSLLFPGMRYLQAIRIVRVLRIFRVLKLVRYIREAKILSNALKASWRKITVFLFTVLILVTIFGCVVYVIEGEANGFTSIPRSIYWAIVTLTTVGYGDLSPKTGMGQTFAAIIMILGYAIIAVPTGIVTVEMTKAEAKQISTQSCPFCSAEGHDVDAVHCKYCGGKL